jgi:selenide,water dikinase
MGIPRLTDDPVEPTRLTQQVACAGCAAKIPIQVLEQVLGALPPPPRSPRLLVGPETWDDAGVYRISPTLALVQTVDFFTPMVDDPYDFGAIAAANAVSDVYAMGGTPKLALSILCFPAETGNPAVLREIVRGGADTLKRAGVLVLGGHSVRDPEIKFGYAVTGEVHPKRVVSNAHAKRGDVLVLTKPIGTGVLATALKRGLLSDSLLRAMTRQMTTLNRAAAEAMRAVAVNAATDVTGFGLLGHARNVARASGKTIRIWSQSVPFLSGTLELAAQGVASSGLMSNREALEPDVAWADSVPEAVRRALVDPQTSGGLLISVPPSHAERLLKRLSRAKVKASVVGEVLPRGRRMIEVSG